MSTETIVALIALVLGVAGGEVRAIFSWFEGDALVVCIGKGLEVVFCVCCFYLLAWVITGGFALT